MTWSNPNCPTKSTPENSLKVYILYYIFMFFWLYYVSFGYSTGVTTDNGAHLASKDYEVIGHLDTAFSNDLTLVYTLSIHLTVEDTLSNPWSVRKEFHKKNVKLSTFGG